ncbi:RagB/SusD family nutrient uptake outer membrane protein [Mucilaginibacter sp. RS28]|uniref:RagB/SusD family nutrient uptake outer membrane protein n=1 Tax=Mucilaginibacter straminoryzae TaxID=2932774 RepID=A0A9X1X7D2_9SPHI|nr:RagB/SusD family nutrient uptake outer membrane protein [Mucilaginibacter straminoryzae]MCJ8210019.1 RagB/SusD family nutrient uptake outer membrane protein [Mucilaginibacter straminoryzae]
MKKLTTIILAAGVTSIAVTSCKKTLDKQDLSSFTASQVYNDSTTTKLSVDYIYGQNQPAWFGNSNGSISTQLQGLTDEQYSDNAYVKGTVTVDNVTDIGTSNTSGNYVKIRTINMFIRDVNAGTLPDAQKKRFIAQALFWRAYRYFELVKLYGGVPLVLTPLDAVGDEAKAAALLPRNKTSETFTQIVKDLDTCIKYIPVKWPNNADYGRITQGAALAFKGRVQLTYASPQFNPGNDMARWQAAYQTNTQAVSVLSANGFGLYPKWDVTMWTTDGSSSGSRPQNPEAVLVTGYNTKTADIEANSNSYANNTVPKYIGTTGGSNQPTWDLARAFPMKDGKDTLTSKYSYSTQTFWKNRDPRFEQTIAYNGANWYVGGNSAYRIWTYQYYNKANSTSTTSSTEITGPTTTGLYLRKAVDPTLTGQNFLYSGTDWIEIRYAEVLMNQAECAAEIGNLGQGQEAYANLIAIRKRAGIESGSDNLYGLTANMNHDQMINAIMKERQIEFAFEGKRYWDLRRRKLIESTLNGKRRMGVIFQLVNNNSGTDYIQGTRDGLANTNFDQLYSTYFTVKTKTLDSYNIAYQTADYFFGIPTASLRNNANLQQNNTWGGPFDPLQ